MPFGAMATLIYLDSRPAVEPSCLPVGLSSGGKEKEKESATGYEAIILRFYVLNAILAGWY